MSKKEITTPIKKHSPSAGVEAETILIEQLAELFIRQVEINYGK